MYAMEKWEVDHRKIRLIEYNLLAKQGVEM